MMLPISFGEEKMMFFTRLQNNYSNKVCLINSLENL